MRSAVWRATGQRYASDYERNMCIQRLTNVSNFWGLQKMSLKKKKIGGGSDAEERTMGEHSR
jgi:hypothetical protein